MADGVFEVVVEGAKYRVTAPDEATAWHWANATAAQERMRVAPGTQENRDVQALNLGAGNAPGGGAPVPTGDVVQGFTSTVPTQGASGVQNLNNAGTRPPAGPPRPQQPMGNMIDEFLTRQMQKYIPYAQESSWLPNVADPARHWSGRAIQGAADMPVGAMQLGANALGMGDLVNPVIAAQREQSKPTEGGFDFARLVGNLANPVNYMGASMLSGLPKLEQMLLAANMGGVVGLTSPTSAGSPREYLANKVGDVALGQGLGAAMSPVANAVGGVARAVGDRIGPTVNLFTGSRGARNLANTYWRKIIGEENVPEVTNAMRNAPQFVANSDPTAGQILARVPAGSPVHAQEQITRATPGGVSAEFTRRLQSQSEARAKALAERDEVTGKLREEALERAGRGGIDLRQMITQMRSILNDPEIKINNVAQASIKDFAARVSKIIGSDGMVNPKGLYAIRENIGDMIRTHSKGGALKGKAAHLERDMQKVIDTMIEQAEIKAINAAQGGPTQLRSGSTAVATARQPAGPRQAAPLPDELAAPAGVPSKDVRMAVPGRPKDFAPGESRTPIEGQATSTVERSQITQEKPQWREYLREFSTRTKAVEDDLARGKSKPDIKTRLEGGANVAEEETTKLPNMLSRPATWVNRGLSWLQLNAEPRIDREMLKDLLNPRDFAGRLEQTMQQRQQQMARRRLERAVLLGVEQE